MSWTLVVADREAAPTESWAVCIDPRVRQVRVEPVVSGAPSSEIGLRAVFRRYVHARPDSEALVWLASDQVAALLHAVEQGYAASMTWSGDVIGTWTPAAWQAAECVAAGAGADLGEELAF